MDIISTETRLLHQITVKGIFNFLTDKNIIVKPIDVEGVFYKLGTYAETLGTTMLVTKTII